MKKFLVVMLTVLMVLGLAGSALADASADGTQSTVAVATAQTQPPRIRDLQGYDQLLQLRADAKTEREQIKADREQLKGAVQAARQAHDTAAIKALKPYRATLKQIMADLKSQWTTQKGNWAAMKQARQVNDAGQMQTVMSQILNVRQAINADLASIKGALDQMLQTLTGNQAPAPTASGATSL
jgi:chromosome segregation ATPase